MQGATRWRGTRGRYRRQNMWREAVTMRGAPVAGFLRLESAPAYDATSGQALLSFILSCGRLANICGGLAIAIMACAGITLDKAREA